MLAFLHLDGNTCGKGRAYQGLGGKESTCQSRRWQRCGFDLLDPLEILPLGRFPGDGNHSSILWKIPQTEEPSGLQSMGSQRVGHDGANTRVSKMGKTR